MKQTIAVIYYILSSAFLYAQQIEHRILPSQTDAAINGNNSEHYCFLNHSVIPINKLLLFFPGTNATPKDYRLFQKTAADLGYHVIGLSYENFESINIEVCPATHDNTCHGRARYEIWFGKDTHESLQISYANSVINRLLKLLKYLEIQYPTENWGQYFVNDSTVNWKNTFTAGHSQGAGNATFGSKYFPVSKVIMFSWVDWMWPGKNPEWITMSGLTANSAYFGFIHTGDTSIYYGIPTTWNNLGMTPYGSIVSVDTTSPPFSNTHSLITSLSIDTTATQPNFHNSTVVDWVTPIDEVTGLPKLKRVWEYLLNDNTQSTGFDDVDMIHYSLPFLLNSIENKIHFPSLEGIKDISQEVYNLQGQCIYSSSNQHIIDFSEWTEGLYLVITRQNGIRYLTKIIKN